MAKDEFEKVMEKVEDFCEDIEDVVHELELQGLLKFSIIPCGKYSEDDKVHLGVTIFDNNGKEVALVVSCLAFTHAKDCEKTAELFMKMYPHWLKNKGNKITFTSMSEEN